VWLRTTGRGTSHNVELAPRRWRSSGLAAHRGLTAEPGRRGFVGGLSADLSGGALGSTYRDVVSLVHVI
jgi:hypothetical protein